MNVSSELPVYLKVLSANLFIFNIVNFIYEIESNNIVNKPLAVKLLFHKLSEVPQKQGRTLFCIVLIREWF